MKPFNKYVKNIEQKYHEIDTKNKWRRNGWRFLYCPKERLEKNNGIIILGLNPGNGCTKETYKKKDLNKNIYLDKDEWGDYTSEIPRKTEELFKIISSIKYKSTNNWKKLIDNSITGNYIFFRTKDIKSIKGNKEVLTLSEEIWKEIISENNIKAIICIGLNPTYAEIKKITETNNLKENKIKWGGGSIKYVKNNKIIIAGFYHFKYSPNIENNDKYSKEIQKVCKEIANYI